MNELLRFTSTGTNKNNILFPPKFEFYDNKFVMYKNNKLVREVMYDYIKDITILKKWQNNVIINCKIIGINIYIKYLMMYVKR